MRTLHPPPPSKILRLRSGFSFAEVMFAVAILGIGFIMVAAVFPVATEQTRNTADEAVAAAVARAAFTTIQNSTHSSDYPDTGGQISSFFEAKSPQLWNEIASSTINPTDPRYAWVPFYYRSGENGAIEVTVLVVRRWIHRQFTSADLTGTGELQPRNIAINQMGLNADGNYFAAIAQDTDPQYLGGDYSSLAPGGFLIMKTGEFPGRSFRLGKYLSADESNVYYQILPTDISSPGDLPTSQVNAAIISKDYVDPNNAMSGFDGPAQDVAVYTTFVSPG